MARLFVATLGSMILSFLATHTMKMLISKRKQDLIMRNFIQMHHSKMPHLVEKLSLKSLFSTDQASILVTLNFNRVVVFLVVYLNIMHYFIRRCSHQMPISVVLIFLLDCVLLMLISMERQPLREIPS